MPLKPTPFFVRVITVPSLGTCNINKISQKNYTLIEIKYHLISAPERNTVLNDALISVSNYLRMSSNYLQMTMA